MNGTGNMVKFHDCAAAVIARTPDQQCFPSRRTMPLQTETLHTTRNYNSEWALPALAPDEGMDLLAGVARLTRMGPENREAITYSHANETSQLLEAVTKRAVTRSIYQFRNGDTHLNNFAVTPMLQRGIAIMEGKATSDPTYAFELARRQYELREQQRLLGQLENGKLNNSYLVTISPFPEEANTITAQNVGYFTKERTGKLRIVTNTDKGVEIVEMFFPQGDLQKAKEIAKLLGKSADHVEHTAQMLGEQIEISKEKYATWEELFSRLSDTLYQDEAPRIVENTRRVLHQAAPVVEDIVHMDQELAKSLLDGYPTQEVKSLLFRYVNATDSSGNPILPIDESDILWDGMGNFSKEAAKIIAKLVRLSCYTRVAQMTHQNSVSDYRRYVDVDEARTPAYLDPNISMFFGDTLFSFCGGSIGGRMPGFGSMVNMLYGVPTYTGEVKVTTCPGCRNKCLLNEAHVDKGIGCPHCSNKVEGGCDSEAIVAASRKANDWELMSYLTAETTE